MACSNSDILALIDYFENGTDLSNNDWDNYNYYDLWNALENGASPPSRTVCATFTQADILSVTLAVLGTFTTPSQYLGFNRDFYYLYLKAIGSEDPSPTFTNECIGALYDVFTVASFDADYQAVLDYANTQGYTLPSAAQQILQNQLVLDLKSAGIWSKLDVFAPMATDGDSDFALIDWIRLNTMTAVNAPTFTENQGFTGNGTSAYINTLYTPSTDAVNMSLNDASFGYHTFGSINEVSYKAGAINSFNNRMFAYFESNGAVRINSNSTYSAGVVVQNDAFLICNRTSSINVNRYIDGALNGSGSSTSDTSLTSIPLYILAANNVALYTTQNVSMYFVASDMSAFANQFNIIYRNYLNAL